MKARKEYFTLYRTSGDSAELPLQPNTYSLFITNIAVSSGCANNHTGAASGSERHTGLLAEVTQPSLQRTCSQSYCLLFSVSTNHSMASSRPVPLVAEVLKICHFRSFKAGSPRELAISEGVMACSMSCLFANTTKMAFLSSSSSNIATSSDLEIPIRSRSQLSTT